MFVKDKFKGKNIDEWQKACSKYNKNYEEVDISAAVSACLAEKDEEEIVSKTDALLSLSFFFFYSYLFL